MASTKYYPTYEEMKRIVELKVPVNATLRSYTLFLYALDEETSFELDVLGLSRVTYGGLTQLEREAVIHMCAEHNIRINIS